MCHVFILSICKSLICMFSLCTCLHIAHGMQELAMGLWEWSIDITSGYDLLSWQAWVHMCYWVIRSCNTSTNSKNGMHCQLCRCPHSVRTAPLNFPKAHFLLLLPQVMVLLSSARLAHIHYTIQCGRAPVWRLMLRLMTSIFAVQTFWEKHVCICCACLQQYSICYGTSIIMWTFGYKFLEMHDHLLTSNNDKHTS